MDAYTGKVFELRQALVDGDVGDRIDMHRFRQEVAELGAAASDDEVQAMRSQVLVAVGEQAAQKLKLGERERERRRRRRKAQKRARRANR